MRAVTVTFGVLALLAILLGGLRVDSNAAQIGENQAGDCRDNADTRSAVRELARAEVVYAPLSPNLDPVVRAQSQATRDTKTAVVALFLADHPPIRCP